MLLLPINHVWQGWLDAGGRGIDTAFDYGDQTDIATVLKANPDIKREDLFILTKVPAGFGNLTDCSAEHGAEVCERHAHSPTPTPPPPTHTNHTNHTKSTRNACALH